MSRSRWAAALLVAVALAGLLAWQQLRERRLIACLDAGGLWNGSHCEPGPRRTILRRGIDRS